LQSSELLQTPLVQLSVIPHDWQAPPRTPQALEEAV
jgi:hypothetical protein